MASNLRSKTLVTAILVTALLTAGLTFAGLKLAGYHPPHRAAASGGDGAAAGEEPLMGDVADTSQYTCGMHPWIVTDEPGSCPICGMDLTPIREDKNASADSGEREIAYYRAPDDPMEIYNEPGQSKSGEELIPVYEDEFVRGVNISIDPVVEQNMGLRTAPVIRDDMTHTIRTWGHVTYDETRTAQVSPKVNGWFEKLYANFTGEMVEKNAPLFEFYSPELVAAQEEYLTALRNHRRSPGERSRQMLNSARRRLELFDVGEGEIEAIEETGEVRKTVMFRSPFRGVVTHKNAVEGAFVKAGTSAYMVADLSQVWVEAHIYEYELEWVEEGQTAEMTLPYRPGKVFEGQVAYVYPYLQQKTRDVVVRLEFENPDLTLKPEMFAEVRIEARMAGDGIQIPSEAVIRSGERNVVFVAKGNGRFLPREVTLGHTLDGNRLQVLTGLAPGERVVTSGQFLLDSESKLMEAVAKMTEPEPAPEPESESGGADDFFGDMESSGNDGGDDFFEDME
mgnify:CR=1 FL=1